MVLSAELEAKDVRPPLGRVRWLGLRHSLARPCPRAARHPLDIVLHRHLACRGTPPRAEIRPILRRGRPRRGVLRTWDPPCLVDGVGHHPLLDRVNIGPVAPSRDGMDQHLCGRMRFEDLHSWLRHVLPGRVLVEVSGPRPNAVAEEACRALGPRAPHGAGSRHFRIHTPLPHALGLDQFPEREDMSGLQPPHAFRLPRPRSHEAAGGRRLRCRRCYGQRCRQRPQFQRDVANPCIYDIERVPACTLGDRASGRVSAGA
mmetsp:Transcript_41162/g.87685  ORF Transcript_41162/g.87685 Transcript_41162/m.87685 type:complete len:259 (-) Transcript_41162:73-849(-)